MSLSFSNPAAFWALLGVPAVVAIHFLQRRSQRRVITTLFLLQQMRRESETGSRIDRLRVSIPFWLQILMVLLLTWLLAGPRWLKSDAVQRIAVVLDSSASMSAFRSQAEAAVSRIMDELLSPLAKAELTVLSSDPEAPPLYHGGSAAEAAVALPAWRPLLGAHDFTPALRTARGLAGEKGAVLLVSDHATKEKLPHEARLVAIGEPLGNAGWTGVTTERKDGQWLWRAIARNYVQAVVTRSWQAVTANGKSQPAEITLAPGEAKTLSGPFPAGEKRLTLRLSADAFTLDDTLPLLLPEPKVVSLHLPEAKDEAAKAAAELLASYEDTRMEPMASAADVRVVMWPPSVALPETAQAIVFTTPAKGAARPYLTGQIVGEPHPLMDGLNWQGLLVREGIEIPVTARDRPLLWQGERSLITLRTAEAGQAQLLCHFDLLTSNARRLPALAVLLHRFLEDARSRKIAAESANFDVRQRLVIACDAHARAQPLQIAVEGGAAAKTELVPVSQARLLRAPAEPAFFQVRQGGSVLLAGASHFADAREADFTEAKKFDELADVTAGQTEITHEADPMWRLWLLLLLAALAGSWWFARQAVPQGKAEAAVS